MEHKISQKVKHKNPRLDGLWQILTLFGASSVMLTVCQAPYDAHYLAWFALIPFILACDERRKLAPLLIVSYIVALIHWLFNMNWISGLTGPGYIVFCAVWAIYWPILTFCVRYLRQKRIPLFLAAPLLFVGIEAWQGVIFTGFSWYYLGHSQYNNLTLIQICDIFGALGVSALIAMVNGLIAELIINLKNKRIIHAPNFIYPLVVLAVMGGAMLYGNLRLAKSHQFQTDGPLIGSVQPNVPSEFKESIHHAAKIVDELIAESQKCVEAGAKLVIWPETMVMVPLNTDFLQYLQPDANAIDFHTKIAAHAKDNAYLLVGAHGAKVGVVDGNYDITDRYNSAYLYTPEGLQSPKRFNKIHLVPFGEFVPFKESAPFIYNIIIALSPWQDDYNLTRGDEFTVFGINADNKSYKFGVLICYEDTDSAICRKLTVDENGQKKVDWLVNVSNDGWYVNFKEDGPIEPSVELAQRTAITVFRCIENRISVIRSVNCGISCLIDPNGRMLSGYQAGSLPDQVMDRQAVAGWFVDRVPIDSRVTFYSRYGQWFNGFFGCSALLVLLGGIIEPIIKRKHNNAVTDHQDQGEATHA